MGINTGIIYDVQSFPYCVLNKYEVLQYGME